MVSLDNDQGVPVAKLREAILAILKMPIVCFAHDDPFTNDVDHVSAETFASALFLGAFTCLSSVECRAVYQKDWLS